MKYVLAIFLPWLVFFLLDQPLKGLLALALQVTVIGWIPATIWAMVAVSKGKKAHKQVAGKV